MLFDQELVRKRCTGLRRFGRVSFLRESLISDLLERLSWVKRRFPFAVEWAAEDDRLAEALCASGQVEFCLPASLFSELRSSQCSQIVSGGDALPFQNQSLDALFALHGLETLNDLPGFLIQSRQALKADGLFIAAMLGGESLGALRTACLSTEQEILGLVSPRVHPMVNWSDLGSLLQRAGFALPVVDKDQIVIAYHSLGSLLRDLQSMGLGNALTERSPGALPRAFYSALEARLRREFPGPDGAFLMTFEIFWMLGWAPHPDQPKALKPGSAQVSLADILTQFPKSGE